MDEMSKSMSKRWLRDASMRRLSLYIKNKTELIGNAAYLGVGIVLPEEVEKSGLSPIEIFHLERWVAGIETGRQCLLALMDYRLSLHEFEESNNKSASKDDEFKPLELIRSMIHLPNAFLCDSGYIFSTIFQRPPTTVVREALQMVLQKAFEKSPSSLGVEQINLAIKQLRIDNLQIDMKSVNEMAPFGVIAIDNTTDDDPSSSTSAPPATTLGSAEEEFFRLQIMIELIRMHIVSTNKRNDERAAQLAAAAAVDHDDDLDPLYLDTFDFATSNAAASIGSIDESLLDKAPGSHSKLDIRAIESHLRTPMQEVVENAEKMTPDDLEGVNASLKPYLKQLSGLKASLTLQLKDLQDSRSFLALGLSSDATDDDIKKAYRTLAIRLHPDKPGGDTARFQQLQDAYHEIMKKRKSDKAEHDAMEEVRRRRQGNNTPSQPPDHQQQQQEQESTKSGGNKSRGKKTNGSSSSKDRAKNEGREATDDQEVTDGDSVSGDVADAEAETEAEDNDRAKVGNDDVDTINAVDAEIFDGDIHDGGDGTRRRIKEEKERKMKNTARGNNNDDSEEEFEELISEIKKLRMDSANEVCEGDDDDGVGPKVYSSGAEHAQAILKQITEVLVHIKHAAGQCTQLAQLNIKWYKMIEKAMEGQQPNAFKEVYKLVIACTGSKSVLKRVNVKSLISNIEACALHQAITPVESICEWAQKISALAMELPNNCGVQYASAAAANKAFIQTIERSMHLSLSALKTVLALISTQEQLASCMRRVKDSMKLASDNMEIQDLLLEMVRTGVKSNVITMSNTVDRVVETTMAASDVRDAVVQLLRDVDVMTKVEARRKAAESETQEMEEDYCEEDREALRKCREERREEDRRNCQRQGGDSNNNNSGGKRDSSNEEGSDEHKAGGNSINDLKEKIRTLQMQLKVQHVQALQTLNSEVVILQTQIYQELQALPFVTSIESLFVNNRQKRCSHAKHQQDIIEFKASLFTLLAELIDSSCHALKTDIARSIHLLRYAAPFLESTSDGGGLDRDRRSLIEKHFHWICIVFANGSSGKSRLETIITNVMSSIGSSSSSSSSMNGSGGVVKLALLPDYRSKTLYLASMVDMEAVDAIVNIELQQRLDELFVEDKFLSSSSSSSSSSTSSSLSDSYKSKGGGVKMSHSPVVECETFQGIELDDIVLLDGSDAYHHKRDSNCEHVVSPQPVLRVIIDMNDIDEDEYVATTGAAAVVEDVDNDVYGSNTTTSSTSSSSLRGQEPIAPIDSTSPASQSTTTSTTMKSPPPQKMKYDDDEVNSSSSSFSSGYCENYENSKPNILNVAD